MARSKIEGRKQRFSMLAGRGAEGTVVRTFRRVVALWVPRVCDS